MKDPTTPKREELQPNAPAEAVVQIRRTLAGLILLGLFLVCGWWGVRFAQHSNDSTPGDLAEIKTGVNPNTAKWHELAQLPGLGESAGRAIVDFRETQSKVKPPPVFKSAADLEPVPGIGQRTIERIAPHLRFGVVATSQPPL